MSRPKFARELAATEVGYACGQDILVLTDMEDLEHPIAIYGADWWMTKTEVAELITALTKALQEAP